MATKKKQEVIVENFHRITAVIEEHELLPLTEFVPRFESTISHLLRMLTLSDHRAKACITFQKEMQTDWDHAAERARIRDHLIERLNLASRRIDGEAHSNYEHIAANIKKNIRCYYLSLSTHIQSELLKYFDELTSQVHAELPSTDNDGADLNAGKFRFMMTQLLSSVDCIPEESAIVLSASHTATQSVWEHGSTRAYSETVKIGNLFNERLKLDCTRNDEDTDLKLKLEEVLINGRIYDYFWSLSGNIQKDVLENFERFSIHLMDSVQQIREQIHSEQQESKTIMEEENHSLVQEEPPINFNQPTWELVMAERRRGALLNSVKVATMSEIGTIEYRNIPTRSYWLSMVLDDWGSTDEEIKDSIADDNFEVFAIEVCGWHSGCGVILRDSYRNPIIVISRAGSVSLFYHELQGVSLGLKLALKYEFFYFDFDCISEAVAEYVRHSWACKDRCGCPPRDDPEDPRKKKHYCVECSRWRLHQFGEGQNADKILLLIDEIFYDALEFEHQSDTFFVLSNTSLSKAQGVWHLANMGKDQELRIDEIDRHEEIAEILYKDVYGHGSEEELKFLYDFEKREEESKRQPFEAWIRAAESRQPV